MKSPIALALLLTFTPVAAFAQSEPPPPESAPGTYAPTAQQRAAMQQMHAQAEQVRLQTRTRMLLALTPAHRTAIANIVGQLVLSANPSPRAAAQALDAILAPAEKQSVVAIQAASRASMEALFAQQRAAFESTLTPDQRAQLAQRSAKWRATRASRPLPPEANDPGAIVLRTLASFGGPGHGMHGHPM